MPHPHIICEWNDLLLLFRCVPIDWSYTYLPERFPEYYHIAFNSSISLIRSSFDVVSSCTFHCNIFSPFISISVVYLCLVCHCCLVTVFSLLRNRLPLGVLNGHHPFLPLPCLSSLLSHLIFTVCVKRLPFSTRLHNSQYRHCLCCHFAPLPYSYIVLAVKIPLTSFVLVSLVSFTSSLLMGISLSKLTMIVNNWPLPGFMHTTSVASASLPALTCRSLPAGASFLILITDLPCIFFTSPRRCALLLVRNSCFYS